MLRSQIVLGFLLSAVGLTGLSGPVVAGGTAGRSAGVSQINPVITGAGTTTGPGFGTTQGLNVSVQPSVGSVDAAGGGTLLGSSTDYTVCSIDARVEATTFTLKFRKIGNSVGLVLPKEMLTRLNIMAGQLIFAVETHGGYSLTAVDPAVGKQIDAGIQLMDRHGEVFVELTK